jgi:uncharacterized protein YigE (DUF2233 family)
VIGRFRPVVARQVASSQKLIEHPQLLDICGCFVMYSFSPQTEQVRIYYAKHRGTSYGLQHGDDIQGTTEVGMEWTLEEGRQVH